ncbi:MAG: hypothetical protein RHS_2238 [Robinsoniella sp. RHS]|nr:MAG: hypothetical protein RHS_2238 [Robinsoniella sp. RHS]
MPLLFITFCASNNNYLTSIIINFVFSFYQKNVAAYFLIRSAASQIKLVSGL